MITNDTRFTIPIEFRIFVDNIYRETIKARSQTDAELIAHANANKWGIFGASEGFRRISVVMHDR